MILFDVNVVVAAYRKDHQQHPEVKEWFGELVARPEGFTVPDMVWSSFVRLVTNRRIFPVPTAAVDAFDFLGAVRRQPRHQAIVPGERHIEIFERLCVDDQAIGDLVPDAYLAALAIEQGASLATLDRDFRRFAGLRLTTL